LSRGWLGSGRLPAQALELGARALDLALDRAQVAQRGGAGVARYQVAVGDVGRLLEQRDRGISRHLDAADAGQGIGHRDGVTGGGHVLLIESGEGASSPATAETSATTTWPMSSRSEEHTSELQS